MLSAFDPLTKLPFLSAKEAEALVAAGIPNAGRLLEHMPRRYEDRRRFDSFPMQGSAVPICIRGLVLDSRRRFSGGGRNFHEVQIADDSGGVFSAGKLTCRWFNMPFIYKLIAAGQEVILHGKVKEYNGRLYMDHPDFEVIRAEEDEEEVSSIHLERIVPIYRTLAGLSQRRLREIAYGFLQEIDPESLIAIFDVAPQKPRASSFREAHFPETPELAKAARRRFALEEFFGLQLNVAWRRARHLGKTGRILGKKAALLTQFYKSLPFDLTGAQKRSIHEIVADMRKPQPMNRLLQGDVGSGKTFVAMATMLLAVDSGCQAALMAPTQILAEQHFLTFRQWLEPLGVRVSLRTSNREEDTHLKMQGEPQMVIGTHALLYDEEVFQDLGLVVIDEQHKFGVSQRAALIGRGVVPDVLVMTATPIPRTLTMTIYGDLDVSLLDEKPPGRGTIETTVKSGAKQTEITKFVKEQLEAGRQAYLVYPLVDESETLKIESATEAFEKWRKRLSGHEVGLIHGKLRAEEKEEVMRKFREGKIGALVSTTVIEVGVDVPNATVMILHHAERFGLAQIHQLRGRIGRGGHEGYCLLLTDGKNPEAMEKLQVLEQSANGFEIAEADLRLRGPGDVLGTNQSGLGDLKFAEFLADTELLREARQIADRVLAEDPNLAGKHQALRPMIHKDEGQLYLQH